MHGEKKKQKKSANLLLPSSGEKKSHFSARSTQRNCPQRSAAADKMYGATPKTTVTLMIVAVQSVKYSKKS